MAEAFGPKLRLPHGLAVALMLPHALDFNRDEIADRMLPLLRPFGLPETPEPTTAPDGVRDRVVALMRSVDIPPALKQHTSESRETLFGMREYMLQERQQLYNLPAYNPRPLSAENLDRLFDDLWEGRFSSPGST
jgi:alcohol dehydrogenase class IV